MSRWKSSVLHEGEGNIRSVKWRGHLIAWANNMVHAVSLTLAQSWKDSRTERAATKGRDAAPAAISFFFFFLSPCLLPLFFFKHLYWSIIALQWCVSFCFITK